MLRRAASGRLAEVLGPDLVSVDKLFRTIGINEFAKQHVQKFLAADTATYQRAINSYLAGINQYIEQGKTPLEFTIIGIPKTPFTKEDVYHAIGFMSLTFAEGFQADPVFQKIKMEFGDEYLKDLAINTTYTQEFIKNYNGTTASTNDNLISAVRTALDKLPVPLFQGSNGWVISAAKSATGFPILANDTHIAFAQPAVWYEAHVEYPGTSFYGHHLAGFPFAVLGNNRFCGWGITMFENDDVDFFLETRNPQDSTQVKFKDTWESLLVREEIIKVKGANDIILKVQHSRHGPIINGIVDNVEGQQPIALSWMLLKQENHALKASYDLLHANSFTKAQQAISLVTSPGLNYMYGDTDGNIAWWAAAQLPIRPAHTHSKLYLDGSSGNDEYLGYYDFNKNPQAINPPWGYVYSANNQPDTVAGVLYPGYYYPRSRAGRIDELLSQDKKFSVEDVQTMMLDATSRMHPAIAKMIAESLPNDENFSFVTTTLKAWDGNHESTSIAPSLYYTILSQMIALTLQDEIGSKALRSLISTSVLKNSLEGLLQNKNSPWWDNISTKDKKETREEIIKLAASKAIDLLKKNHGEDSSSWTWSKLHTLTHTHPLGIVKPLDKVFNVGPFAVGSGSEVINNLDFLYDTTAYFPVLSGPALRKITDFSNIENGVTISPTGQSGNIMSEFYDDQAEMFANGTFRKMLMNRKEIEETSSKKLVINPKRN